MYAALILDDEAIARKTLQCFLQKYCPQVTTIYEAAKINEATSILESHHVDMIFADIHLGKENVFDMLKDIRPGKYALVFVTADALSSMQAIKAGAVDYLVKPVSMADLETATVKAISYIRHKEDAPLGVQHQYAGNDIMPGEMPVHHSEMKLVINHGAGFDIVDTHDIIYAAADGNYTTFYIKGRKKIMSSKQLGHYEDILQPPAFFRTHKSYIINLRYLTGYSSREGCIALMEEGHQVNVSRRKLHEFLGACRKLQV